MKVYCSYILMFIVIESSIVKELCAFDGKHFILQGVHDSKVRGRNDLGMRGRDCCTRATLDLVLSALSHCLHVSCLKLIRKLGGYVCDFHVDVHIFDTLPSLADVLTIGDNCKKYHTPRVEANLHVKHERNQGENTYNLEFINTVLQVP